MFIYLQSVQTNAMLAAYRIMMSSRATKAAVTMATDAILLECVKVSLDLVCY